MKTLNFTDPIYEVKFKVVLYDTEQELREYLEEKNKVKFYSVSGGTERLKNSVIQISLINELSVNTVAHECWHALEFALFLGANVNLNLEGHNEHIAYYLGWLIEKVWKFCVKEYKAPEILHQSQQEEKNLDKK